MEEVAKKKRGRPKKQSIQLPEEIAKIVEEVKAKEDEEIHQMVVEQVAQYRKGDWDVGKDDNVSFFDPTLSYEITGYKPINKTQGLDFNPNWFTEARDTFKRTGHYTQFHQGTKAYNDFFTEEYRRCRDGYTVNGYTITGDHYFFLNYYQLLNTAKVQKAGSGRSIDFPNFVVAQYEYFHYLELCKVLHQHACLMKARGLSPSPAKQ